MKKSTDLVLDEGSEGQVVEEIREVLPDVGSTILAEALIIETVPEQERKKGREKKK